MADPFEHLLRSTLSEMAEEAPTVQDPLSRAQRRARNRRRNTLVASAAGVLAALVIGAPFALAAGDDDGPSQPATVPSPAPTQPDGPIPVTPGPIGSDAPILPTPGPTGSEAIILPTPGPTGSEAIILPTPGPTGSEAIIPPAPDPTGPDEPIAVTPSPIRH